MDGMLPHRLVKLLDANVAHALESTLHGNNVTTVREGITCRVEMENISRAADPVEMRVPEGVVVNDNGMVAIEGA